MSGLAVDAMNLNMGPGLLGMSFIVFTAYAVFGMVGFGGTMLAMPFLVHFMPLSHAVPLMVLLDLVATTLVGARSWKQVSAKELLRLLPFMVLGIVLGVTVLSSVKSNLLLLALGIFVVANAAWGMWGAAHVHEPIRPAWAAAAGTVGGVFGATFGSGGPIYTIYLARRLPDVDRFKATISVTLFVSAVIRITAFGTAGILQQPGLFKSALMMLPLCLIGVLAGIKLRARYSPLAIKRSIYGLLFIGGASAIVRSLSSPT